MQKPFPIFILFITATISFLIAYLFPAFSFVNPVARLSGIVTILMGVSIICWSSVAFKAYKTTIAPYRKPKHLITDGPFHYSRNPIYVGMLFILVGICIVVSNLLSLIMPIIFITIINKVVIASEEKTLLETFGSRFTEYKKSVRKWL